jgi:2'-5' RNA ligase
MQRLFVGIALPDLITQHLGTLTGGVPGARWQRPDQIHLTLRFIGDVDGAAADDARTALSKTTAVPFDLQLEGVGHFGEGRRIRALWFAVAQNATLVALQGKVERALVGAGFAPESRKFKPHVTVARMGHANHERVAQFLGSYALFWSSAWHVDAFHLYSSQLSPNGSLYQIEDSYDLAL